MTAVTVNFILKIQLCFKHIKDKAKRLYQPSKLRSSYLGEKRLFMRLLLRKQYSYFFELTGNDQRDVMKNGVKCEVTPIRPLKKEKHSISTERRM